MRWTTTVGVALRGHPFGNYATGGHGEPPLQLSSAVFRPISVQADFTAVSLLA